MIQFRTPIKPLEDCQGLVSHSRPIVMLGSCFTENIGSRLENELFYTVINPSGTLYNPASIASVLLDLLYGRDYTEDDLFMHDGLWHSYSHHSRFSGTDIESVLSAINSAAAEAREALASASALIITFGTSYIYRLKEGNRVVANCHKMPAGTFNREMLTATQTVGLWKKMLRELSARFPHMKVIFTVSPIRHLADGAHENQVSKAALLLAVDRLIAEYPDTALYFPSYEIMLDDLRDYRFYTADMVHPSDTAVDYIYDIFKQSFMDYTTLELAVESAKLVRRLRHRPMTQSQQLRDRFLADTESVKASLLSAHPCVAKALGRLKINRT